MALLALLLEASEALIGVHLPCAPFLLPYVLFTLFSFFSSLTPVQKLDKQGRPMIIMHSSRKSITPSAEEAYHEEGEEEEEPLRPAKCQRTAPASFKGKGKDKGKGKAQANTPAPSSASSHFPLVDRKTRGKRKKDELPSYVPPRPVPTMDTVRLAAESLAKEQREPTVVRKVNHD
jgi:hypothetical protein